MVIGIENVDGAPGRDSYWKFIRRCVCVRAQKCQDVLVVIAIGFQSDDVVLLLSACPRWCAHVFVCVRWVFVVLCCVVCARVCVCVVCGCVLWCECVSLGVCLCVCWRVCALFVLCVRNVCVIVVVCNVVCNCCFV